MTKFGGLTRRNLLIYFKNLPSVLFSLLTPVIILFLYLLFLRNTFVDAIQENIQGLESLIVQDDVDMLANLLLLSGILGSTLITVSFTALTTIVQDREQKIDYDISATPMKRWQIILSYFTASTLTTFLISLLILGVGIFGFSLEGNLYLSIWNLFKLCGITLLGSISATALFMPIMLLFSTVSASSAFFGILSAAVDFLIGAYIPLSQFSTGIQTLCNIFPGSGITILFRNILMHGVLNEIDRTIDGIDQGAFINSIEDTFCFQTNLFGHSLDCKFLICYIIVIVMVSLIAMIGMYAKVYKRN